MGKEKICAKCGNQISDSKSQKAERGMIERMLRLIRVAGVKERIKKTEEYCYGCWKIEFRDLMKPYAQELGKATENW